jgi:sugar porter (SP) family MFS transporter
VGMESSIVPMYLLEISPAEIRGSVGTLHQFAVTIGIMVSSLIGAAFVSWVNHGWQVVLGLTAVPAIAQIICAPIIAESPRWLMLRGRRSDSIEALRMLHPDWSSDEMSDEIRIIEAEIENATKNVETEANVKWGEIFSSYPKEVLVGLSVMSLTAITGVNTVIFYSTDIFKLAGLDQSIIGTIVVTVTNVGATFLAVRLVERAGRKKLLTTGMWIMILPLVTMTIVLLVNIDKEIQGAVAIACVVIFIVGFAVGLGAVSWVIVSEIVPARIRAKCNGLFVSTNWFINILISVFTLTSIESLGGGSSDDEKKRGVAILYGIFACITMLGLLLVYSIVNETGSQHQQVSTDEPLLDSTSSSSKKNGDGETIDLFDNRHRRQSSGNEPLEF